MNHELVEKAYNDGLAIASLARNMSSSSEEKAIQKKIDTYCAFLDENFGTFKETDTFQEESCYIAFDLRISFEQKCIAFEYTGNPLYGNVGIDEFVQALYSDYWLYEKILFEFDKVKNNRDKAMLFAKDLYEFLQKTNHLDDYRKEKLLNTVREVTNPQPKTQD